MSILQDLDPQYAKIHAQSSLPRKGVIATGAILLALGGAYWGMVQIRADSVSSNRTPSAYSSQASFAPDEMQKRAALASAPTAKPETPDAAARAIGTGSGATIRDESQGMIAAEVQTPKPALADSPDGAAGSLADTEYRRQTQTLSGRTKTAHTHGAAKRERKSAAAQPAARNERVQLSGGKRTNERDIDIITAIVR